VNTSEFSIESLESRVGAHVPSTRIQSAPASPVRRSSQRRRRTAALIVVAAVIWCLWDAGIARRPVVNGRGWELFWKFWRAAPHPRADGEYLRQTVENLGRTVAYAVVSTALSVVIGALGAVALSTAMWKRRLAVGSTHERTSPVHRVVRGSTRSFLAMPRGIHEAVWGLLLLNVLGRDPLVAVLAIAIPYGAITARVFADLIDTSAAVSQQLLRASGVGRISSLLYGILPAAGRDLVSYGFYRLECSLRSAVILGMIGAGGLGFQLNVAFQGLAYSEMWTCIYALLIVGLLAEMWGTAIRRRSSSSTIRWSLLAGIVMIAVSIWYLRLAPWTLWSSRSRRLAAQLARDAWPPAWPRDGVRGLASAARETLQMSFLAMVIASLIAAPMALVAARSPRHRGSVSRGLFGTLGRVSGAAVRTVARVLRTIPPTVWALLVVFVLLPGILPGAVALALFTAGVLTRLFGEVLEHTDRRPSAYADALGAPSVAAFAYGALPEIAPKLAAYSLYRWEVAARDAVVVGIVGAGGLGRLISAQTNALNYRGLVVTLAATVVLTVTVDLISALLRRTLE
jgi:phosphonate transport system permease protein